MDFAVTPEALFARLGRLQLENEMLRSRIEELEQQQGQQSARPAEKMAKHDSVLNKK